MSDRHEPATDRDPHGPDGEHHPSPMRRRTVLTAAVAGTAAIVAGRSDRAAAASGSPVILGADNTADNQTIIRNTARFPVSSNRGMFVTCTEMQAGRGIEATGSHAGVSAIGRSDQSQSPNGTAVGLEATTLDVDGYGAFIDAGNGRAPLRLGPVDIDGPPTTGSHDLGEILFDRNGRLFACSASGFPGTWVELGAAAPSPVAVTTLNLLPAPDRFVDTRTGFGGVRGPIAGATTTKLSMTGRPGQGGDPASVIPDDAVALAGNLTVSGTARVALGSSVTVWAEGRQPATPNVFFGPAGLTCPVANSFVVALTDIGGHRGLQVFNSAPCDLSLDVTGYFSAA